MKAKFSAIAGSALFLIASNLGASASPYDISGGWLIPPYTFSGTFDFSGSTLSDPDITITSDITHATIATLTDAVSSSHIGGAFYTATVDDGTGPGTYSLTFDFTLPTKKDGLVILAALFETETRHDCTRNCTENVLIAGLGAGDITVGSTMVSGNVSGTPLPAALPLFAGGLGIIGLVSRRRKRKSVPLAAA